MMLDTHKRAALVETAAAWLDEHYPDWATHRIKPSQVDWRRITPTEDGHLRLTGYETALTAAGVNYGPEVDAALTGTIWLDAILLGDEWKVKILSRHHPPRRKKGS